MQGASPHALTSSEENSKMRCGFIVPGEVEEEKKSSNTWLHPGLHQEVGFQVDKCPTAPRESTHSSGCGGGVPGWPQAMQTLEQQEVQSVKPPHPVWHADRPVLCSITAKANKGIRKQTQPKSPGQAYCRQ